LSEGLRDEDPAIAHSPHWPKIDDDLGMSIIQPLPHGLVPTLQEHQFADQVGMRDLGIAQIRPIPDFRAAGHRLGGVHRLIERLEPRFVGQV